MERARRLAAERRAASDRSAAAFESFLANVAVPLVRQIANILKAEGYSFTVFTPSGSVRLMSDKGSQDFIEITLETQGASPRVIARVSHVRGRHIVDAERTVASGDPAAISEQELLEFLMKELEPFVER